MEKQRKATILVVDDTPENLRVLIGVLQQQGYKIRAAPNGERALVAVRRNPPDLILLDVKMPGMNGYDVCKQLKADTRSRDIPVLFISALDELADKVKGFESGALDYIHKPFQVEEVLARVKTHLTLRRLQREREERNARLQQEIDRRVEAEEELRALNGQLFETNQQLETANQELHEANAAKDKFFSMISHDLRGPFTGLIGMTGDIVENIERYNQDRIKKVIGRLHASSKKVYTLLTNLLEWSRLQRGRMPCQPENIIIRELVEHNLELLASQAERKQVRLNNQLSDAIWVYADTKMLDGVIRNLLSNALKFTASGGTIDVSAQVRGAFVEVTVSDSGIGMEQNLLATLFRLEAKSSRRGTAGEEGTGLGLILCKEFIEKNGGTIRVESEAHKGSHFIFSLPAHRASQ